MEVSTCSFSIEEIRNFLSEFFKVDDNGEKHYIYQEQIVCNPEEYSWKISGINKSHLYYFWKLTGPYPPTPPNTIKSTEGRKHWHAESRRRSTWMLGIWSKPAAQCPTWLLLWCATRSPISRYSPLWSTRWRTPPRYLTRFSYFIISYSVFLFFIILWKWDERFHSNWNEIITYVGN